MGKIITILIEKRVIKDGDILRYKNKGDLKLVGFARRDGTIEVQGKRLSATAFEQATGFRTSRPYDAIFLSNGKSLSQALSLVGGNKTALVGEVQLQEDDNDEYCHICCLGGELVCCETCPATFHTACVGLPGLPEDEWFCASCSCAACGKAHFATTTASKKQKQNSSLPPSPKSIPIPCDNYTSPAAPDGQTLHVKSTTRPPVSSTPSPPKRRKLAETLTAPVLSTEPDAEKIKTLPATEISPNGPVAAFIDAIEASKNLEVEPCDVLLASAPPAARQEDISSLIARVASFTLPVPCSSHVSMAEKDSNGNYNTTQGDASNGGGGGDFKQIATDTKAAAPPKPTQEVRCAASGQKYHYRCLVNNRSKSTTLENSTSSSISPPYFSSMESELVNARLAKVAAAGAVPLSLGGDSMEFKVQVIRNAAVLGNASSSNNSDVVGYVPAYTDEQKAELRSVLSAARQILNSGYTKIYDSRTGDDVMPWLLKGSKISKDADYSSMHTAVLYAKGTLVAVALFRVFGSGPAEVPLLVVRPEVRRQGLGRLMLGALEHLLLACGAEVILTPAFIAPHIPLAIPRVAPGVPLPPLPQSKWGYELGTTTQIKAAIAYPLFRVPGIALMTKVLTKRSLLSIITPPTELTSYLLSIQAARKHLQQELMVVEVPSPGRRGVDDEAKDRNYSPRKPKQHRQTSPGSGFGASPNELAGGGIPANGRYDITAAAADRRMDIEYETLVYNNNTTNGNNSNNFVIPPAEGTSALLPYKGVAPKRPESTNKVPPIAVGTEAYYYNSNINTTAGNGANGGLSTELNTGVGLVEQQGAAVTVVGIQQQQQETEEEAVVVDDGKRKRKTSVKLNRFPGLDEPTRRPGRKKVAQKQLEEQQMQQQSFLQQQQQPFGGHPIVRRPKGEEYEDPDYDDVMDLKRTFIRRRSGPAKGGVNGRRRSSSAEMNGNGSNGNMIMDVLPVVEAPPLPSGSMPPAAQSNGGGGVPCTSLTNGTLNGNHLHGSSSELLDVQNAANGGATVAKKRRGRPPSAHKKQQKQQRQPQQQNGHVYTAATTTNQVEAATVSLPPPPLPLPTGGVYTSSSSPNTITTNVNATSPPASLAEKLFNQLRGGSGGGVQGLGGEDGMHNTVEEQQQRHFEQLQQQQQLVQLQTQVVASGGGVSPVVPVLTLAQGVNLVIVPSNVGGQVREHRQ